MENVDASIVPTHCAADGPPSSTTLNIHHLELFYHVVRFGGITAAARQMPYGIQQSTISSQILLLEDTLGKQLFRRRPFELTAEGRVLFSYIEPFFSGLDTLGNQLRGGADLHLRIACPEIVQHQLPDLLAVIRARVPGFHFSLVSARINEIAQMLRTDQIDIGLATATDKEAENHVCRVMLRMELFLLVPAHSAYQHADEILGLDRIDLPLVTLPRHEPACRIFQDELRARGVDWYPSLELASLELITRYVSSGFGIGLALEVPGKQWPDSVRTLRLPDFPKVIFGAFTKGPPDGLAELFLEEVQRVTNLMSTAVS
ncbi:MAG: LysR family transcriptional regulator [Akkermansiaceae bacterium]